MSLELHRMMRRSMRRLVNRRTHFDDSSDEEGYHLQAHPRPRAPGILSEIAGRVGACFVPYVALLCQWEDDADIKAGKPVGNLLAATSVRLESFGGSRRRVHVHSAEAAMPKTNSEAHDWLRENGFDPDETSTAFCRAAEMGEVEICKWIYRNAPNSDALRRLTAAGANPFLLSCKSGNLQLVKWLVLKGSKISSKDYLGYGAMHYSCRAGSLEVAKWLWRHLGTHSITERSSYGDTPLLLACAGGHRLCAEWLMSLGADATTKNTDGDDAYSEALRGSHLDMACWLKNRCWLNFAHVDALGCVDFHRACAVGDERVFDMVDELIAPPRRLREGHDDVDLSCLCKRDERNLTPMDYALRNQQHKAVRFFVAYYYSTSKYFLFSCFAVLTN